MNMTLLALTKKKKRPRLVESSAEEWKDILNQAETERLEYYSNLILGNIAENQSVKLAENSIMELEDDVKLEVSVPVVAKRKRAPRFIRTFGNLKKEGFSSDTT